MTLGDQLIIPSPKPVTHVIFDMDGLLIDSEYYYSLATNNVTQKYGKEFTWSTKVKCMGATTDVVAETVINDLNLPITINEYINLVNQEYPKVFKSIQLMPGAEKLLKHFKKHNIPMAIATSSKKTSFELKIQNFGPHWLDYFHHILLAPEEPLVKKSKPAPDTFLICRDKFDHPLPDHEKCLVFEDAPFGALAGCRAGMQVVMVPDERIDVKSLFSREPEFRPCQIIKSLEDFKPEDFSLPPF